MSRLSLRIRLERLKQGYSSDMEYDALIVSKMANTTVEDYLKAHKDDVVRLFNTLNIPEEKRDKMTYSELASVLHTFYTKNPNSKVTESLLFSLSKPMTDYYEFWREKHERQD